MQIQIPKEFSQFWVRKIFVDSTPEVILDREPMQEEWTWLKWSGRAATDIQLASPSHPKI